MFDVNLNIISELKTFLLLCQTNEDLLDCYRSSKKAFTRDRKLGFERLVLFISKLCKRTLSVGLDQFFEQDIGSSLPCSVSAFSQQRQKLDSYFFKVWNEVLFQSFYHYGKQQVKRWNGYRLIAADGSVISLPYTQHLLDGFGGIDNKNASYCGAQAFFHYDVLNKLFIYSRLAPYRVSETALANPMIEHMDDDTITIYDRGFCNYKTMLLHRWAETEKRFVIRAKLDLKYVKAFIEKGIYSEQITIYPGYKAIRSMRSDGLMITANSKMSALKVRLVRVDLPDGTVEVLVTNLWEEEGYDYKIFGDLYFKRWGVETAIGTAKNLLQLECFSGLTVNSVCQDFYATVFMANLTALFAEQAITEEKAEPTPDRRKATKIKPAWPKKTNMNKACGKLRQSLVQLFMSRDPASIIKSLIAYLQRHKIPIIKGRSYDRKRKRRQMLCKHKTFNNYKDAT